MAVTGTIFQKDMRMQLTDMNKRKILSHATSIGNRRKKTEDGKTFFISNIVSIVSSLWKKTDQN